ncbi:MAG: hypothetical protein MUF54_10780 [Polyangiaceae bacterium]|jgi:hypothetical protein|nr:hypothetical protein [Polyangiaceae bacterium]
MIRKILVGSVEVTLILLAAYAFFFMNVGRRTPYGHLAAIFSTEPAQQAADDFKKAGKDLKDKVMDTARP